MKTANPARLLARVRAIALGLPEVSERPSHGAPTWFAGKRVFATFWNDHHGEREHIHREEEAGQPQARQE